MKSPSESALIKKSFLRWHTGLLSDFLQARERYREYRQLIIPGPLYNDSVSWLFLIFQPPHSCPGALRQQQFGLFFNKNIENVLVNGEA